MRTARLACASFSVALSLSCASGEDVTRRRGEWTQDGRRISPLAYAWYARGTHHEREGKFLTAARDYRVALDHDPVSGSSWAALGRVLCQMRDPDTRKTFEHGLKRAERRAPIYSERGSCRLREAQGDKDRILAACEDFSHAMRLEPHAFRPSTEYAGCLRRAGKLREAIRHERAARLFFGTRGVSSKEPTLRDVDRALLSGDLMHAQHLSLELMSPGALSARAVLLGQNHLARTQAELVLRASPADVDASTALLALGTELPSSIDSLRGLSPPGLMLLFKVLKRKANSEIAHDFLDQYREELLSAQDPLVTEVLGESAHAP